jgi:hypothetical protein
MSEKEKRKEKPKGNSRRFIGLSIFLTIAMLMGIALIFGILLAPEPTFCCEWTTKPAIETANSINLTLISASETAAVAHATATAEAEHTP